MAKKIGFTVVIILFVAGLGFLLFPPISNFIGTLIANSETQQFDAMSQNVQSGEFEQAQKDGKIDDEGYPIDENGKRTSNQPVVYDVDIKRLLTDSVDYNNNLKLHQGELLTNEYAYVQPSLDLAKYGIYNGIYGYVSAPTINMNLPIYLGASNSNMNYGAAHLTYTSLPIGGNRTNTVLAAHTGYIGRIFFDNLKNLNIGDEVTLKNYWTTLSYKVVDKEIHKPNDSQSIFINDDRDLLTMLTCISDNNGDFDRYYVICERAD